MVLLALLLAVATLAMFPKPWPRPVLVLLRVSTPLFFLAGSSGACVLAYQARVSKARQQAERVRPIPGLTAPRDSTAECGRGGAASVYFVDALGHC